MLRSLYAFGQRNLTTVSQGFATVLAPQLMRSSLRRGLHAIYFRGDMRQLTRRSILAPTHHSWWDGYLVWYLGQRLLQPLYIMMDEKQLDALPFLRAHGAFGTRELRFALRQMHQGSSLVIFPEGELRAVTNMHSIQGGLQFFCKHSEAKLHPLVIRLVMRGAEKPEAWLLLGQAVALENYLEAMHDLQLELEISLAETPAEQPPAGYQPWQEPLPRFDVRMRQLFSTR